MTAATPEKPEREASPTLQPNATSPIHSAVWDRRFSADRFAAAADEPTAYVRQIMDQALALVRGRKQQKTLHTSAGKIAPEVIEQLASLGYFGLLVPVEYGGSGASWRSFTAFITRMATIDSTIAGLAAVHGCIGAVDALRTFGTTSQQERWLPVLARGKRLSAFALTEPGAGSDLTALKTTAVRQGDQLLLTGEKLFITNADLGRTIGLVCLLDKKPAMVIVDLPDQESDKFQLLRYDLHALQHTVNQGLKFRNFAVPIANLLTTPQENGLTMAYHGLNRGRAALCANAAGVMRQLLASMLPWANYRQTYGAPIASRELVQRRIGRLAGLIVASDAVAAWCGTLLDQGGRGEMECIVAKIFGSDALKEAAVDLCLKTLGGRAFLQGQYWGDHLHDFLATGIYEGEGELLGLALFRSLVKQHTVTYIEPLAQRMHALEQHRFRPYSPGQMWVLRKEAFPYLSWLFGAKFGWKSIDNLPDEATGDSQLQQHAKFAIRELQIMGLTIDRTIRKQLTKIAERQCRLAALSARVQLLVVYACTALAGMQQKDELTRRAAEIFCWDANQQLTGKVPNDDFWETITELGADIAQGEWHALADVVPSEIPMRYDA